MNIPFLALLLAPNIIHFLVVLLVLVIVCGLVAWLLAQFPLPEPWGRIARILLVVIPVVYIILFLLSFI